MASYHPARIRKLARCLGCLVALVGASVLAGWLLDIPVLKSIFPGLATMKANTAFAFILSGSAVAGFLHRRTRSARILASILAASVFLIGFLSWEEYLHGVDLHIDEILILDREASVFPGRMAPMTAIGFCLAGTALLAAAWSSWKWTQAASILLLILSMITLLGYAYEVDSLYQFPPYTSMAMHAAATFQLLAISLLFQDPSRGIPAVLLSSTAGGMTARRLLLFIPAAIFLLSWLVHGGFDQGWFEAHFALALVSVLCIFLSAGIVLWHAKVLHRIDLARTRNEDEIRRLNEGLERKVEERTRELQDTLDHVKRLQGLLPICAWCKKVRDDHNYWQSLENYLTSHTDARITHSICPECLQAVSPEPIDPVIK